MIRYIEISLKYIIIGLCIFNFVDLPLLSNNKDRLSLPISSHQTNFQTAQKVLNDYLMSFDTLPKGWKQFKRAESFWQNRCFPNGDMSSAKYSLKQLLNFNHIDIDDELKNGKKWINLSELFNFNHNCNNKIGYNLFSDDYFWEEMGPYNVVKAPDNYEFEPGNGRVNCITFMPDNDSIIFVGAASGGIWKSVDAGNTWRAIPFTGILSLGIMDIAVSKSEPNVMYASTGDASGWNLFKTFSIGILKSTDYGETWSISSSSFDLADSVYAGRLVVDPNNSNIVYAATSKSVLKTIDGGLSWTSVLEGYDCRDIKINENNSNIIYVATFGYNHTNYIFVSKDAGSTWEAKQQYDDICRIELATTPSDPNLIYAITSHRNINLGMEGLYISRDAGSSWDTVMHISDTINYINLVDRQSFYNLAISIAPDNPNEILVGGVQMYYTKDAGKNWVNILGDAHCDIHRFSFSNSKNKIYTANDGGIYWIYRDTLRAYEIIDTNNIPPLHWNNITDGLNITQYYRIGAHPYTDKYFLAGSQDNGTHILKNGKWQGAFYGDGMQCQFHPKDLTNLVCSYQRGGNIGFNVQDDFPWITEFAINPIAPDTMLIAGTNVWLQNLNNSDIAFKLSDLPYLDNNNEIRAIAVTPQNKDYIYASRTNRLYSTKNYGSDWKELYFTNATIVDIKINPNNIDMIWTAHSGHYQNEKVLQFSDTSIKNLSYNLPNVSINAVEFYPDENLLFAGTDIGVFVLDLNDTVWYNFNNKMPNVCINELEYVPNTGYLYAASWGRGAWKCRLKICNDVVKPVLNFEGNYEFCNPYKEFLPLTISNKIDGYQYLWSNGSTEDTINAFLGTYYAVAISPDGCSEVSEECTVNYKDINLILNRPEVVSLTKNPNCPNTQIKYQCICDTNYISDFSWSNGSKDTIAGFDKEGEIIKLFYTYHSGCSDTLVVDTVKYFEPIDNPVIVKNKLVLTCNVECGYYEWYHNDNLVYDSWFRDYKITAPGKYYAIIYDDNFCPYKSNEIIVDFGSFENDKLLQAKITPNPNHGFFTLELYTGNKVKANINILDAESKVVKSFDCTIDKFFYHEIDCSALSQGQYFIKIDIKDYSRTLPFNIIK